MNLWLNFMERKNKKRQKLIEILLTEVLEPRLHKDAIVKAINTGNKVGWNDKVEGRLVSERIKAMKTFDNFFVDLQPHVSADLSSWSEGVGHIQSLNGAFRGTQGVNLKIDNWDLGNVTSIDHIFFGAMVTDPGFAKWGNHFRNNVTSCKFAFADAYINVDLTSWEPKEAIDASHLFSGTEEFKGSISKWNMSRVRDLSYMFEKESKVNQDISNWKLNSAATVKGMFFSNKAFTGDLTKWGNNGMIKPHLDMCLMFEDSDYAGDLSTWDLSKVKLKDDMFKNNNRTTLIPKGLTTKVVNTINAKVDDLAYAVGDLDGAIDATLHDAKKVAKKVGGVLGKAASGLGTVGSFFVMPR